jgi:hypothetical protein
MACAPCRNRKTDADTNIGQADKANVEEVATKIATEMNVDRSSPWQRSVRQISEEAQRDDQEERDMIHQISDDMEQVKQPEEGFGSLAHETGIGVC